MKNLIEFPSTYSLRAIGSNDSGFEQFVVTLFEDHVPETDRRFISSRDSGGGKYRSMTITFIAQSQDQLNNLYSALGQDKRILMLL